MRRRKPSGLLIGQSDAIKDEKPPIAVSSKRTIHSYAGDPTSIPTICRRTDLRAILVNLDRGADDTRFDHVAVGDPISRSSVRHR